MKHVYRNPNIAKRQVGILNARIEPLNLVFGRYSVKLRPQNLYAATLGFEDWGSLVLFSEKPPVDATFSSIHWEKNFSIRLERKWSEELSALAVTEAMQLIRDVAANRKDNSSSNHDDADFDGLVYESSTNELTAPSYQKKLRACLSTNTPPDIQEWTNELLFAVPGQAGPFLVRGERATCNYVAPYNPALEYQKKVLEFAKLCITFIGLKDARASKLWTLEFAYDVYDAAVKRNLLMCNLGEPNPILFLDFFAHELGYENFEGYQSSQNDPLTCNYDQRADFELAEEALRMRIKMREGYLYRYLSKLGLPTDVVQTAFTTIRTALQSDIYSVATNKPPEEIDSLDRCRHALAAFDVDAERSLNRIQEFLAGGPDLDDHEEIILQKLCSKFPRFYREPLLRDLKPLCKKWGEGSVLQIERARRFLEHLAQNEEIEWTFIFVKHLLAHEPNGEVLARTDTLLKKILKVTQAGKERFTDKDLALEFVRLASERLNKQKASPDQADSLKATIPILECNDLLTVAEIKLFYFMGCDSLTDKAAFDCFFKELPSPQKSALSLGFLPKEYIPASLEIKRGAK